ncbi:MAG: thioesterase [Thermoactinospora sp.]|nr:thioesterase [Thermoactinospora sp.]
MSDAWISGGEPRKDAEVRLFCFAHAGGGSALFRKWDAHLSPTVDVCPVVLPGREGRLREMPFNRMEQLVEPLFRALAPHADRPFALFGHSMGAAVAYEMARRFADSPHGEPAVLFASGRRAPHLPTRRRRFSDLSEDELLDELATLNGTPAEVMDQRNLLEVFLPTLRADFELNESYTPLPGPGLSCPVSAFLGDTDPEVDQDEIAAWADATRGPFMLRLFEGDHFYLKGPRTEVLEAVREDLAKLRL